MSTIHCLMSDRGLDTSPSVLGALTTGRPLDSGEVRLRFTGDYSLADSVNLASRAAFVSPMRVTANGDEVLDLVFAVEGPWRTVGVRLRQTSDALIARIFGNPDSLPVAMIQARLEHIFALDVDGAAFQRLGRSDAVVARLQSQRRGVRPVLFPSPYEAAARAIIGHRLPVRQAAAVSSRLSADHGVSIAFDDHDLSGFPAPDRLADLPPVVGLADRKRHQLRALGTAAAEGWLDTERLQALLRDDAMRHLQKLGGIGPFSAELILLRGVGDPDAFPLTEMRLHRAMAVAYDLPEDVPLLTLERIAEDWSPYRTWVGLLLRNTVAAR